MSVKRLVRCSTLSTVLFLLLTAVALLGPQTAQAQYWMQTTKIVTPVENGPLRTLLDSLVQVAERNERRVARTPRQPANVTIPALQDTLLTEHGLGVTSANKVFIDYRFEIDVGSRLQRDVTQLHFLFRPGPGRKDISILTVDGQASWVQDVLLEKGTDLRTNEAALIPFRQHLEFVQLARSADTEIVEIGGETVRSGFAVKKEDLIERIRRLTYEGVV